MILDHLIITYNVLNTKYGSGLHFILAGDKNDLKLEKILSLSPNLVQIVKKWTRINPPAILDPIIMTLSKYYQEAVCLEPLDKDPDKVGKKSDHKIVVSKPITTINNKSTRTTHEVTVRPFPKSGLKKMEEWFVNETWEEVTAEVSSHKKAEIFQSILLEKLDKIFPTKTRKIT